MKLLSVLFQKITYSPKMILSAAFFAVLPLISLAQQPGFEIKTIVIDAGHGGKDPGASVGNVFEKDIVLNVALITGKLIQRQFPDVKVIYTRDKDTFPALHQRAEIANKNKADLFISIHANAIKDPVTSGTETFILGQHRSEENLKVAQLENAVILLEDDYTTRYQGFDPNSAESYIMFELLQNEFLEQSRILADYVETNFSSMAKRRSRGVKQAGFLVLTKTTMPSVLIELGFITNNNERDFLTKKENQELMAQCIANSFAMYKNKFDPKKNNVSQKVIEQKRDTTSPKKEEAKFIKKEEIKINENNPARYVNSIEELFTDSVLYAIQIVASPTRFEKNYAGFNKFDIVYEYFENNLYKYYCETTTNHDLCITSLKKVRESIKDAFPVLFVNGKKEKFRKL